ncbi:MAG: ArnT family glycosyltransferase, partial [Blastocatellia bacterium]
PSLMSDTSSPNHGAANRIGVPVLVLLFLLCSALFLGLIRFSGQHPFGTYATETDFYHLYAPDARRLAAGQFPENAFQGPGYPLAVACVSLFTSDLFLAGKWLSMGSAILCVILTFVLFAQLFSPSVGLGAAALVITGSEFLSYSISATTDMFFLPLCLATIVVFNATARRPGLCAALTGALCGLTYLTRYNGVFLLVTALTGIIFMNVCALAWRPRLKTAALTLAVFLLTISPWLSANAKHRGSPFHNQNYLNIATEFFPELTDGDVFQDATRSLAERFHSFGDVLRYDPVRLLKHYPINFFKSLWNSLTGVLIHRQIGWLALIGLVMALLTPRAKPVMTTLLAGLLYLLLMALNHWETRYYLFVMIICAGLAVYAISGLARLVSVHRGLAPAPLIVFLLAGWNAARPAHAQLHEFLDSHPMEIPAARDFLRGTGAAPHSLKIVARKPHLPFLADQEWVFIPPVKSPEELRAWLSVNKVDYIMIGKREMKERKALTPLGDPAKAPEWLEAAWVNDDPLCILYRPRLSR